MEKAAKLFGYVLDFHAWGGSPLLFKATLVLHTIHRWIKMALGIPGGLMDEISGAKRRPVGLEWVCLRSRCFRAALV